MIAHVLILPAPVATVAAAVSPTPFKFLDYYEEGDAARFAGRERDVAGIADAATVARSLVLYGKSGLGKTSVLLAGVFPELRRRGYVPIHVRTLRDPAADVARELRERVLSGAEAEASESLVDVVRRSAREAPVVLVLDQFEEFFIRFRGHGEVYEGFVAAIGDILNDPDVRAHIIFSLREEYLADLDDFRTRLPALFENEYRLRPMTAYGVREAITKPLQVAGIPFDTRLVSRLVDELSTKRFDSVMLQILCQEVFERAAGRDATDVRLTTQDLHEAGEIDAIFRRYLDRMTRHLPKEHHLRARVVLRALMTQERTKQAMRIQDFTATVYRLAPEEVAGVLDTLKADRLVRLDVRGGESWYELTHERLVPILDKWLRLDKDFNALVAAHDLVATPARGGIWREAYESLLPSAYLDVVHPFRDRLVLTDEETEFLLWSAVYRRHDDLPFWAERHGMPLTRTFLLEKLDSPDLALRRGAAFGAGEIASGALRERLQRIVLHDHDVLVRQEAARALHRVGGASLESALRAAATRSNALDGLAGMYADGDTLSGYSLRDRWSARRRARKRIRREKTLLIADAGMTGLVASIAGTTAWGLTLAPVYAVLFALEISTERDSLVADFSIAFAWMFLSTLGIAMLVAFFAARTWVIRASLPHGIGWGEALRKSAGFEVIFAVWTAGWLLCMAWLLLKNWAIPVDLAAFVVTVTVCWWTVPLLVGLAQRVVGADGSMVGSAVRCATVAGVSPLVSWWLVDTFDALHNHGACSTNVRDGVAAASILGFTFLGGLTTSVAATLSRVEALHHTARAPGVRSGAHGVRSWFVPALLAASGLVWTFVELGVGVIPWPGSDASLGPGSPKVQLSVSFARTSSIPRVQHRRLTVAGAQPVLVAVDDRGDLTLDAMVLGSKTAKDLDRGYRSLFLLPGNHMVSFSSQVQTDSWIAFQPRPALPLAEDVTLASSDTIDALLSWKARTNALSPTLVMEAIVHGAAPGPTTIRVTNAFVVDGMVALDSPIVVSCNDAGADGTWSALLPIRDWSYLRVLPSDAMSCVAHPSDDGTFRTVLTLTARNHGPYPSQGWKSIVQLTSTETPK